jgi:hypothetical protein
MQIENQVEKLLFEVIEEVNEQLPEAQRIEKKKAPHCLVKMVSWTH